VIGSGQAGGNDLSGVRSVKLPTGIGRGISENKMLWRKILGWILLVWGSGALILNLYVLTMFSVPDLGGMIISTVMSAVFMIIGGLLLRKSKQMVKNPSGK